MELFKWHFNRTGPDIFLKAKHDSNCVCVFFFKAILREFSDKLKSVKALKGKALLVSFSPARISQRFLHRSRSAGEAGVGFQL